MAGAITVYCSLTKGDVKINKFRYWMGYKRVVFVSAVIMILMMTMVIFSQLAMEIYVYDFAISKNIKDTNISVLNNYMNYLKKITDEEKETIVCTKDKASENPSVISFIMPVKNGVTTSTYGDKVSRTSAHQGHDWAVNVGTKVKSSADGVVEKAYYSESYGYNILVNHGNGFKTRYAHLSEINVSKGEKVKQNQLLGLSGSTGQSTGPHLHFEMIKNGKRVNPLNYVK